jgi:hypothetical protein
VLSRHLKTTVLRPHHSRANRRRPLLSETEGLRRFSHFHPQRRRRMAIDDGGGGAGLSPNLFAIPHIKRMTDTLHRAVVGPKIEIIGRACSSAADPWEPSAVGTPWHGHDPPQSLLAKLVLPVHVFAHPLCLLMLSFAFPNCHSLSCGKARFD